MTMRQMCETISRYWERKDGIKIPPEKIFHYSPSGELFEIFFWYAEATNKEVGKL